MIIQRSSFVQDLLASWHTENLPAAQRNSPAIFSLDSVSRSSSPQLRWPLSLTILSSPFLTSLPCQSLKRVYFFRGTSACDVAFGLICCGAVPRVPCSSLLDATRTRVFSVGICAMLRLFMICYWLGTPPKWRVYVHMNGRGRSYCQRSRRNS
jgi:hypothetical protein